MELFLPSVVYAPVSEGETLGEMTLTLDGLQLARVSMVAQQNSPEKPQEKKEAVGLAEVVVTESVWQKLPRCDWRSIPLGS